MCEANQCEKHSPITQFRSHHRSPGLHGDHLAPSSCRVQLAMSVSGTDSPRKVLRNNSCDCLRTSAGRDPQAIVVATMIGRVGPSGRPRWGVVLAGTGRKVTLASQGAGARPSKTLGDISAAWLQQSNPPNATTTSPTPDTLPSNGEPLNAPAATKISPAYRPARNPTTKSASV
jgi:hypothetical protein